MKDKDEEVLYLWRSQYYEFGIYIKKVINIFMKMELPHEEKKEYLDVLRDLYKCCVDDTLTYQFIQSSLFLDSKILDVLIEQAGTMGEHIKKQLAFQYVNIQLAQWDKEE